MASATTPKASSKPSFSATSSSDSSSSVRISSPLNPGSPPSASSTGVKGRSRGPSVSTIREATANDGQGRTSSTPNASPSTATLAQMKSLSSSSVRGRSRSKSPARAFDERVWRKAPDSPSGRSSSWRPDYESKSHRPWKDTPQRRNSIPPEQTESWELTKLRVHQATSVVLDITHEALSLGADFLGFAPIPGLEPAARTLLQIWDNVQGVDMNRMACLRLTQRCAETLLAVRQEIRDAGDEVAEELSLPISKLTETFQELSRVIQKQSNRPFLKRYLKREEILRELAGCDADLTSALTMFSIRIQIRTLKQTQKAAEQQREDTQRILESLSRRRSSSVGSEGNALRLTGMGEDPRELTSRTRQIHPYQLPTPPLAPPSSGSSYSDSTILPTVTPAFVPYDEPLSAQDYLHSTLASPTLPDDIRSPSQVLRALQDLRRQQNEEDANRDMSDLRNLMKSVLSAGSDVEILELLGVTREEMPEAIKTLQRALERVCEREQSEIEWEQVNSVPVDPPRETAKSGLNKMVRRFSQQTSSSESRSIATADMQRSKTVATKASGSDSSGGSRVKVPVSRDTLDREFLESGIDALRRLSRGAEVSLNLPNWTITRYEVDREQKIGIGFFSDVYRGTWRNLTVAIKVLAETTPRNLFVREVEIWKKLKHPNVLELYGASSTSGDPPWFLVSPYEKNGSLSEYLRRMAPTLPPGAVSGDWRTRAASAPTFTGGGVGSLMGVHSPELLGLGLNEEMTVRRKSASQPYNGEIGKEWNLLRFMYQIAKGMDYLHSQGVLHGDLKASNVLVDDQVHCMITDFGQSEMKSEAYRISGASPPHGTLRWQAPELMQHMAVFITNEMDVYAFAITCIEVLSMGRMPWPLVDDEAVRHFVLRDNTRPPMPATRFTTDRVREVIQACWDADPSNRPVFSKIVQQLRAIRDRFGMAGMESSPHIVLRPIEDEGNRRASPPMYPILLPDIVTSESDNSGLSASPGESFITARSTSRSPPMPSFSSYADISGPKVQMPEPVPYVHSRPSSTKPPSTSRTSSVLDGTSSEDGSSGIYGEQSGYESPEALSELQVEVRNERRYRMLLNHDYHPSLTLPLWSPSVVELGAVGYLSKPEGRFVTLFNSLTPEKSDIRDIRGMSSIRAYGEVNIGTQRISDKEKKSAAQRGLDAIAGLLTFSNRQSKLEPLAIRRSTFPLRAGHRAAYLLADVAKYSYVPRLEAPKRWFKENIDQILEVYGADYRVQREDIFLVIGRLTAQDYGLFVSHNHPEGQVHFNSFSSPEKGMPWGEFRTDTVVPSGAAAGPIYNEFRGPTMSSSKVSRSGGPADALILAKIRFKPDAIEPTSL